MKRKLNFGAQKGKEVYIAQPANLGKIGFDGLVKEFSGSSTVNAVNVSFNIFYKSSLS